MYSSMRSITGVLYVTKYICRYSPSEMVGPVVITGAGHLIMNKEYMANVY